MSRALWVIVAVVALAWPASAAAGGWATVGLSSMPDGTPPGGTWVVDIEVLQHGRTPLDGVQPAVLLRGPDDSFTRVEAKPTGRSGIYRAQVAFPTAGTWSYRVDDGFSAVHDFAPVRIDGEPVAAGAPRTPHTAAPDDGSALPPILGAALAGLLAAGGAAALLRRRARMDAAAARG